VEPKTIILFAYHSYLKNILKKSKKRIFNTWIPLWGVIISLLILYQTNFFLLSIPSDLNTPILSRNSSSIVEYGNPLIDSSSDIDDFNNRNNHTNSNHSTILFSVVSVTSLNSQNNKNDNNISDNNNNNNTYNDKNNKSNNKENNNNNDFSLFNCVSNNA
jgi:hypothetical protein